MKISNEAREIVQALLKENNCNALQVSVMGGCCGTSVYLSMTNSKEDSEVVIENGVQLLYVEDAIERASEVLLVEKNGKLFLEDKNASNC
ncbi:MAG: hypothetical protein CVU94_03580 [Firmicutes bacterium HGW-Firmicutes-19]|jgi:Fe-S cluster assembly iron-binding protein IscA|nr:MAG: hypothetical protein CVU94_03580 [Firmicutes bacterium HGW-Firmicutes-19]